MDNAELQNRGLQQAKPYIWQMIKEAVEYQGGKGTHSQIREYIKNKYGAVNDNSISAQITVCTVNSPSRIHYPENHKARVANSRYDFLFSIGRGQVEFYDPERHGIWEIRKDELGKLVVLQAGVAPAIDVVDKPDVSAELPTSDLLFPIESHLRDFLARNLGTIVIESHTLQLYIDENGRDGVEYPTDVGPIDILAIDEHGDFVVFELKLSKGIDAALGQILRYMGWVNLRLANGRKVRGVIVAKSIDEKLKYAASMTPEIALFEYEMQFSIHQVQIHG